MRGIISAVVSNLAGCDVAEGTPLSQAGLDSLAFVELRNELARCAIYILPCDKLGFRGETYIKGRVLRVQSLGARKGGPCTCILSGH